MRKTLASFVVAWALLSAGCTGNKPAVPAPADPKAEKQPASQAQKDKELPVTEIGYCYLVYSIPGYSKDEVRKIWGEPSRTISQPEKFLPSNNDKLWKRVNEGEVEQWVYDGPGIQHKLVTFGADGRVVRAMREWSDF
jgi:hypothetical protein